MKHLLDGIRHLGFDFWRAWSKSPIIFSILFVMTIMCFLNDLIRWLIGMPAEEIKAAHET